MRTVQIFTASLSLLCLAGWLWQRKPYSPTDELPPVAYSAFELNPPTVAAGVALATAARGWEGVTATVFDSVSRLLVISHELVLPVSDLESRLSILTSQTIVQKKFPAPVGPQCPVPSGLLAVIPAVLAGVGGLSGMLFLGLFFWSRKKAERTISNFSHQIN